jgi:hypothetical protein
MAFPGALSVQAKTAITQPGKPLRSGRVACPRSTFPTFKIHVFTLPLKGVGVNGTSRALLFPHKARLSSLLYRRGRLRRTTSGDEG